MLNLRLEAEQIDYEACAEHLLPRFAARCAQKRSPGELEKLVMKLGPDAAPCACRLLRYIPAETKDVLTVWLVNAHREALRRMLTEQLENILGGNMVEAGSISASPGLSRCVTLTVGGIYADYAALLKSPLVSQAVAGLGKDSGLFSGAARLALGMGSLMGQESLEKQFVSLLSSDRAKNYLLSVFSDALSRIGLVMVLRDYTVSIGNPPALPPVPGPSEGLLPDAVEDAVLDALAKWLRQSCTGRG